jgi:hypothetical protein
MALPRPPRGADGAQGVRPEALTEHRWPTRHGTMAAMTRFLTAIALVLCGLSIVVSAPADAAAPFLVMRHDPTTVLNHLKKEADGSPYCVGTTEGTIFGIVSGGVWPYIAKMAFTPEPPFDPAVKHFYIVHRENGEIFIIDTSGKGASLMSSVGASMTYKAVVTIDDAGRHHGQVTDTWRIVGNC